MIFGRVVAPGRSGLLGLLGRHVDDQLIAVLAQAGPRSTNLLQKLLLVVAGPDIEDTQRVAAPLLARYLAHCREHLLHLLELNLVGKDEQAVGNDVSFDAELRGGLLVLLILLPKPEKAPAPPIVVVVVLLLLFAHQ